MLHHLDLKFGDTVLLYSPSPKISIFYMLVETSDFGHIAYSKNKLVLNSIERPYSKISILRPQLQKGYAYFRGRTVDNPNKLIYLVVLLIDFSIETQQHSASR
jgi:hypothetical protein